MQGIMSGLEPKNLKDGGFPDLSGDGKITQKDILMGRGVIKKANGGIAAYADGGPLDVTNLSEEESQMLENILTKLYLSDYDSFRTRRSPDYSKITDEEFDFLMRYDRGKVARDMPLLSRYQERVGFYPGGKAFEESDGLPMKEFGASTGIAMLATLPKQVRKAFYGKEYMSNPIEERIKAEARDIADQEYNELMGRKNGGIVKLQEGGEIEYDAEGGPFGLGVFDEDFLQYKNIPGDITIKDFTDLGFDPDSKVDKALLPLLFFPPAYGAAKLIKLGYGGYKLVKALKKISEAQKKIPLIKGTSGPATYIQGQIGAEIAGVPSVLAEEEMEPEGMKKGGLAAFGSKLYGKIKDKFKKKKDTKKEKEITDKKPDPPVSTIVKEEAMLPYTFGRNILSKIGGGSPTRGFVRSTLYPGVGTGLYFGGKALFGDDEDSGPKTSTITPEESTEVEASDRLGDILRERTMAIAAESGRATPVFFDYVKAFPSSYMEKVGRDPEFAKQMMAGFLAMMKPVAGPVPVNPFVAFGEAAMAEGVRQEGEIPDQLKLIETISQDPELLKAYKRFQRESTPTPLTQKQANAAALENIVKEELYGKDFDKDKDKVISVATGNELSKNTLLEMYYDSGEDLGVLLEKVAASDD
jgi:hypothetical protein|tara:strand:+ start:2982 stop:4901 length:1920 start_codon:yes stop_codon:yes gene_type:complete